MLEFAATYRFEYASMYLIAAGRKTRVGTLYLKVENHIDGNGILQFLRGACDEGLKLISRLLK